MIAVTILTTIVFVVVINIAYNVGRNIDTDDLQIICEKMASFFNLFLGSAGILLFFIIYKNFIKPDDSWGLYLVIMTYLVGIGIRYISNMIITKVLKYEIREEYFKIINEMTIYSYIISLVIIILTIKDKDIILTAISVLLGRYFWFDTSLNDLKDIVTNILENKLMIGSSFTVLILGFIIYIITLNLYLLMSLWMGICLAILISIKIAIEDKFICFAKKK